MICQVEGVGYCVEPSRSGQGQLCGLALGPCFMSEGRLFHCFVIKAKASTQFFHMHLLVYLKGVGLKKECFNMIYLFCKVGIM